MKTGFDTFQTLCNDTLGTTGYAHYCEPARQTAEKVADWVQSATAPILNGAQSTWKKTGKHYGEPGQLALVVLVAGIAYNLIGRKKGKKGDKTEKAAASRPPINKYQPLKEDPLFPQEDEGPAKPHKFRKIYQSFAQP